MDYLAVNKDTWNKRTKIHLNSKFYDVEKFLAGGCSLNAVELAQVGDVKGMRLLHLQCHFGQDTLSWARLGADVTGVDLSSEAIKEAELLAKKLNIEANFICDDVLAFGENNHEKYDIVYTSYGVLCWLADIDAWAKTVSDALVDGGQFNLVEFHPFNDVLSGYAYFPSSEPDIEEEPTYTENATDEQSTVVTWPHSMSEVMNALIRQGISIESFNEFAYSPYNCFEGLEEVAGKGFQLMRNGQQVPLLYSIKGVKL
ncbi:class I SAM-dependent methyltransferase [Litorilituus lipolyticus]|uniref:Class I SAM-dependent methyltransferase n=1 Tax=Litorilituus lipolyticus TaxID=2491017 RepID=A0A502KPQ2_9GAMM|nr:class I SAM-dependent methyltransferase [Litorilituus lipolyticus]TPH13592.1 class I SAM-dependent methyltransferase [Litorilituus lipolyticus]